MTLRAGFMGSPEFAVPSLHAVARSTDLRVVVCQPDRPAGRGRKLTAPAVKVAALELGVPIEQPTKMKDGTLLAALARHDLEVIVVAAFGRILPPEILALPTHGCINVHASALPRWRGAAPIQRAVLAGDPETGITIMAMDAGLDTGAIHRIARTPIGARETAGQLTERLAQLGAEVLAAFLSDFPAVPPPTPQDPAHVTLAPPLDKAEGVVDWSRPSRELVDHVRGMDPWPTAFTQRGGERLQLFAPELAVRPEGVFEPGQILGLDAHGLVVAAGDSAIAIGEVQPAGKKRMPARAYAAGHPFTPGERLGSSAP